MQDEEGVDGPRRTKKRGEEEEASRKKEREKWISREQAVSYEEVL